MPQSRAAPVQSRDERLGLANRLVWICPAIGFAATAALLWLFGLKPSTALAIAFLVTCPALAVWLMLDRRYRWAKPQDFSNE